MSSYAHELICSLETTCSRVSLAIHWQPNYIHDVHDVGDVHAVADVDDVDDADVVDDVDDADDVDGVDDVHDVSQYVSHNVDEGREWQSRPLCSPCLTLWFTEMFSIHWQPDDIHDVGDVDDVDGVDGVHGVSLYVLHDVDAGREWHSRPFCSPCFT